MKKLLILCLTCLVVSGPLIATPYSDAVLADGAVHYWRFEETATSDPALDSAGSANGTYSGNILLGQPSAGIGLGNAARFDGVSGTHVALGPAPTIGNSISAEAWVNLDANASSLFIPIVTRWDGSFELDVNATASTLVGEDRVNFVLRNDSNAFGNPASSAAVTRGDWHHVVGVFDSFSGMATVYMDGVAGTPFNLGGVLQDAGGDDGNWYIGTTRSAASGFNWDGLIDEVAIYDSPLSAETIAEHHRLGRSQLVPDSGATLGLLGLGVLGLLVIQRNKR